MLFSVQSVNIGAYSYMFSICGPPSDFRLPNALSCQSSKIKGPFVLAYRSTNTSECLRIPATPSVCANGSSECGQSRVRTLLHSSAAVQHYEEITHQYSFGCGKNNATVATGDNHDFTSDSISGMVGRCGYRIQRSATNISVGAAVQQPACRWHSGSDYRALPTIAGSLCTCACGSLRRCTLSAAFAVCDVDGDGIVQLQESERVLPADDAQLLSKNTALIRLKIDRHQTFSDAAVQRLCKVQPADQQPPLTREEFERRFKNELTLAADTAGLDSIWALGMRTDAATLRWHRSAHLIPAVLITICAVADLGVRTILPSPERELMEVNFSIIKLLPSIIWRSANWLTCCGWIVSELWGYGVPDVAELAQLGTCDSIPHVSDGSDDYAARSTLSVRQTLNTLAWLASGCLVLNGLLCLWAIQFYYGIHSVYRKIGNAAADAGAPPKHAESECRLTMVKTMVCVCRFRLMNLDVDM
eukprot:SAG31_NODE_1245_length_9134_cov_6.012064_10_plen_473_part_00